MAELIRSERIRVTRISGDAQPPYRVWNAINPPGNMDFYAVASPEEAYHLIARLTEDQMSDPTISCNAFGLEELEDVGNEAKYYEWYNDDWDGEDIAKTDAFGTPLDS